MVPADDLSMHAGTDVSAACGIYDPASMPKLPSSIACICSALTDELVNASHDTPSLGLFVRVSRVISAQACQDEFSHVPSLILPPTV